MLTGLTLRCEVQGTTTTLTITGPLDAHHCGALRDALDLAWTMRGRGPVAVDLDRVDLLSLPAVMILLRAADRAARSGRPLALGRIPADALPDAPTARFVRSMWPNDLSHLVEA